ncbi:L,D-transpeptidase family protein [Clostridium brassicae]|uniref:Peptidoglycan binding domain-containing protein n=1 Tax=Clostridium brassicae TaxID=2999072 RepID=A0ABT4D7W0_9CLOT|nr:L,D-transpeptidase family protein [Clostridium brassicae]MCY6958378.1 peptidoglycan binding domain-containing protein [Clostridium brassicae]
MKDVNVKKFFKSRVIGKILILIALITLIYLFISLYFVNHFFFNTAINGVDISLKAHGDVEDVIKSYIKDYKLQLIERNGEIEEITGKDIKMQYNEKNSIYKIYQTKNSFKWIIALLKEKKYYVDDLFVYNKDNLENKINKLNCLNKDIIETQNVSFKYVEGLYETVKEVYGNRVYKDKLNEAIKMSILEGKTKLDLNESLCYENPKYTLSSDKTLKTKNLLNKYVSTKITYIFGSENEILDGNIINQWLSVDENLEVVIDKKAVNQYVQGLSKKYDTVGIARKIKTSKNKIVEVKGGFYGWKINCAAETKALLESIKFGEIIKKEPIYAQKALSRGEDDIGNTYVEINITRQHLWFYKNGNLITEGDVVTGNPNRGNSTEVGIYMLNYKEREATLTGPAYEAEVSYWMPFNGNIGIHDARWRHSFGRDIYKRNGTHGCVNTPLYLAKTIFDNIEDGTPIICYEE